MPRKINLKKFKLGGANLTNTSNLSKPNAIIPQPTSNKLNRKILPKLPVKPNIKKIFTIILIIILIILVIWLGTYIYKRLTSSGNTPGFKTNKIIPYIHDGKMPKKISGGLLPVSSEGNEYTYNFWLYVNDYTYRYSEDKCVMYRGIETDQDAANPGIWLLKKTNTLRVTIGTQTKSNNDLSTINNIIDSEDNIETGGCSSNSSETNNSKCDIVNFPLQRWVNLSIALNNQTLDIYMDGKLEKSCVLSGAPNLSRGNLYVSKDGGYNGFLANLSVSNRSLDSDTIYDIYKNGPKIKATLF